MPPGDSAIDTIGEPLSADATGNGLFGTEIVSSAKKATTARCVQGLQPRAMAIILACASRLRTVGNAPVVAGDPLAGLVKVPDVRSTPTDTQALPVDQYVAALSRKRMAAGVLFRDMLGRVLLVEPSYKPNWEIPGGAVEDDEPPWAAAQRELAEELGADWPLGRLLVVDYVRPHESRPEGVVFVFDGGMLDETDVEAMVLPPAELRSAGFYTLAEARERVKPLLADRVAAALQAVEQGVTALCDHGRRVA